MKLPLINFRITLLNIMLAIAVLAITLAISRPKTELWPTYLAVIWLTTRASAHDPATHDSLAQEFTSPGVIRDVLADPSVAGLAPIQAAADPRKELLDEIHIEVHPGGQGYLKPTRERIRVVIESTTASDAVIVRDALMVAYLAHSEIGQLHSRNPGAARTRSPSHL